MYVCVYIYVCRCCVCIQVLCLQLLFLFFPHWFAAGDSCENRVSHTLLVMLGHGCRPPAGPLGFSRNGLFRAALRLAFHIFMMLSLLHLGSTQTGMGMGV
jgi:hypothetical protein